MVTMAVLSLIAISSRQYTTYIEVVVVVVVVIEVKFYTVSNTVSSPKCIGFLLHSNHLVVPIVITISA